MRGAVAPKGLMSYVWADEIWELDDKAEIKVLGWDLEFQVGIWPQGWGLGLEAEIWAN